MKKLLLIVAMAILLGACSNAGATLRGGSEAEKTVKKIYKAALEQDLDTFSRITSPIDGIEDEYDEALAELAEIVHDEGGTEKLKFTEVKKEDIVDDAVEYCENTYENGWKVVMVSGDSYHFFWLLDKVDGKYYAYEAGDWDFQEFFKNEESYKKYIGEYIEE